MSCTIGHASGCHFGPAVITGWVIANRFPASDVVACVVAQTAGAVLGALVLSGIASGKAAFALALIGCLIAEVVLTLIFLLIIPDATGERVPKGGAPLAIGLRLTLIYLGWTMEQLWLFWLVPVVGAAIAGLVYPAVAGKPETEPAAASKR